MEMIQQTARTVTSKPVQRAVVNTALASFAALSLLGVAAVATALFFQNFVPDQVLTTPVHLQYGSAPNPYGLASLSHPAVKSAQEYDISLTLSLPRSPPNTERGNFMVSLFLLDTPVSPSLLSDASKFAVSSASQDPASVPDFGLTRTVLFNSRRPAILPYIDSVTSLASRSLFMLWNVLFAPVASQTCTLTVPLAERVSFPRLTGSPRAAYIEIEAGQTIQIYDVALTLTAQLTGLRYFMFHFRLPTYLLFTVAFWLFEVLFMSGAFVIFSSSRGASPEAMQQKLLQEKRRQAIRDEQSDIGASSDHPHTFPTYGKQPRLKHEPPEGIKRERDEEEEKERLMSELPVAGTEADDEDDYEEDDFDRRDSGIGTSYSEDQGGMQPAVRKRTSRSGMK